MDAQSLLTSPFVLLVGIMLIFYFLVLRPQKKKDAQRRKLLEELKKGDRIVTIGGLYGEVVVAKEKDLIIRIDREKDVRLKIARAAVSRLEEADDEDAKSEC